MGGRVLIMQLAKLGDFIQSTPLLANARRAFPGAETVLACEEPSVLEAAKLSPLVDEAIRVADAASLPSGPFEALFTLNSHPRALALAETAKSERRFGPRLSGRETVFTPAQNFIMALMKAGLRDLGRFNLVDVWNSLCPGAGPEELVWPAPRPAPLEGGLKIGFQLGAKNHLRRWPAEYFAELAQGLSGEGLAAPLLLGLDSEKALGMRFEKLYGGPAQNLMGRTNLGELAALLASLDLLVTADTGTMHLAAALGTPVLALFFGPAYAPETGPYGEGHFICQALAPCAPCRENAQCRRRQCLALPSPAVVLKLARLRLNLSDEVPEAAPGQRLWRTARDSFGQYLAPLGRPKLTDREALALLAAEAARPILRPGESAEKERLLTFFSDFDCPSPICVNGPLLRKAAAAIGNRSFSQRAESLAASLGVKIA